MAKEELDLFDLTTGLVAQAGTSAAQIVRCKLIDIRLSCSLFDDLPNDFGRHPVTPDSTVSVNPARFDNVKRTHPDRVKGTHPLVNGL